MEKEINKSSKLTFLESTGIIIGHGVGSGILSVPFFASRNSLFNFIWIALLAFFINILLHLMVAELSYNNDGAQFVKCLEKELFKGKLKKILSYTAFFFLGLSVIMNCCSYIVGSQAVLTEWFSLPKIPTIIVYYIISAIIVFFGVKIVGISEKYSSFMLIIVILILTCSLFGIETNGIYTSYTSVKSMLALYGLISFSLSSVMSVPTVVKGTGLDKKQIFLSIVLGITINFVMIMVLAFITLIGAGDSINRDGAIMNLSQKIGGWVKVVGYVFTILALSTSLWANTLILRDIVHEQTKLNEKVSWLIASLPSLIMALFNMQDFVGFTTFASAVQIVTGLGIVVAYGFSRRKKYDEYKLVDNMEYSPLLKVFGSLPFRILVIMFSVIATIGSLIGSSIK